MARKARVLPVHSIEKRLVRITKVRQDGVQSGPRVAFGKHKAVSTFHLRIARVNPHVPVVEHYERLDDRHTAADMSDPDPANRVHGM